MATEPVFGKSYTLSGGKLDSGEFINITFTWNGYKYNFIPFTDHYTYPLRVPLAVHSLF